MFLSEYIGIVQINELDPDPDSKKTTLDDTSVFAWRCVNFCAKNLFQNNTFKYLKKK